jgi:uncharacterized protein (DUF362 family)
MMKPVVSLVRYKDISSVGEAIRLCDGFKNLKPTHRVLLKPNICTAGGGFIPPYGTVTTTAIVEGMVRALKDTGVNDIAIGEGTVTDELGTNTMKGYKWIQLDRLARRYGVKLIDFNAGPHKKVMIEDVPMNIAEAALDTDFFINLPVLKTHQDARVSLAGKNLKGCMSLASKRFFHGEHGTIHYRISRLMEAVPQHLVVIDGIYAMEKGPDATIGTGRPRGILAASTDFLSADAVGVRLLGAEPVEAQHLKLYAERHGRLDVLQTPDTIEVRGERIEDHAEYLEWRSIAAEDMQASGHTGYEVRAFTDAACSQCFANLSGPSLLLAALSRNKDFNDLVIVFGKSYKEERNSPRTLLFGNCAIKANKSLDKAMKLEGCPPKFWTSFLFLTGQMKSVPGRAAFYARTALCLAKGAAGVGLLPLPRFDIYKNKSAYDINHYRVS